MHLAIQLISLLASSSFALEHSRSFRRQNTSDTDYVLKKGPLDTPWTDKVGTNPWPEYPRPQMARSDWKNLNGVWRYQNASDGFNDLSDPPFGETLAQPVLVPYCLESALSGVMGNFTIYSWYSTSFDVPSSWASDNRVLLNFGAVDYNATIYINGEKVHNNIGGYWSFTVDVTDYLSKNGTNELLMFVFDPTNLYPYNIPIGKQKLIPEHIFYTPCSGIWQTVWLESAPEDHITELDISAAMDGTVNVTVLNSGSAGAPVEVTVYDDNELASALGESGKSFVFKADKPQLWSPDSPKLYNITVKLGTDTVQSYTGFRTISKGEVDGVQRPLLNGEFVFQFGTLDQGYWPDGLHSPPSREAMVYDLQALKEVGYNMLRKHIKVEPALFYQACDELGLMLIQDMPALATSQVNNAEATSCDSHVTNDDNVQKEFARQLEILIKQHRSYPSIVTWVIYNEGWGQPDDNGDNDYEFTDLVRSLDPTRLIDTVTGWRDHGAGDFHDNHHYSSPQCGTPFYSIASTPYDPKRIGIQGEFGGIGNNVSEEHAWKVQASINQVNQTYELDDTIEIWNFRAHELFTQLQSQVEKWACSGAVWTQTTDVEGEVNGMLTYDRRVNRMDKEQWKKDIQGLYDAAKKRAGNATMSLMSRGDMSGV